MQRNLDAKQDGDLYAGPADSWNKVLSQALEEPGVLAGFSTQENLPDLRGGILHDTAVPYAYVPLARRIDIDRVYRVLRESRFFHSVAPWGGRGSPDEGRGCFKTEPWAHLNVYKVLAECGASEEQFEIGVTDNKTADIVGSRSGARLYCRPAKAKTAPSADTVRMALLQVMRLLPEADVDRDKAKIRVAYDGRDFAWGAIVEEGTPCDILIGLTHSYVPTDAQFDKASTSEKQTLLREAFRQAEEQRCPNNSLVRERLHTLAYQLAKIRLDEIEAGWQEMKTAPMAGDAAAGSAALPAPPTRPPPATPPPEPACQLPTYLPATRQGPPFPGHSGAPPPPEGAPPH